MNVLLTGGFGAIGSWALRKLIKEGFNPVVFENRLDLSLVQDLTGYFKFVQGDILELANLLRVIKEHKIKQVIHLAALMPPECRSNPIRGVKVNIDGTVNVLEACCLGEVERVVIASSKAVYAQITGEYAYPAYKPINEDYPRNPDTMYGITKLTCELLAEQYAQIFGLDYVVLRFGATYGPGKLARHGIVGIQSTMIEAAYNATDFSLPQGGDEKDDMVYNADVGNAIYCACLARNLKHRIFHIGTGEGRTLAELASILRSRFPRIKIEVGPGLDYYQWGEKANKRYGVFNIDRAKAELDYTPKYSLESGVENYLDFLKRFNLGGTR